MRQRSRGWLRVTDLERQAERAFERGDFAGASFTYLQVQGEAETLALDPMPEEDSEQGFFDS